MIKCPFCQYENENGAFFCEQCKSDLLTEAGGAESPPALAEVIPEGEAAPDAPAKPADVERLPADARPRLVVLRGLRVGIEYPLYEGHNFIGRMDEKPVDIDLEDQESPERMLCSRQHAVITYEDGKLIIEDLNSTNYTYVNRAKIYPGQKRPLRANDVIQVGTVQMRVLA